MTKFFSTKARFLGVDWSWGDAALFWSAFALGYLNQLWAQSLPPIS